MITKMPTLGIAVENRQARGLAIYSPTLEVTPK